MLQCFLSCLKVATWKYGEKVSSFCLKNVKSLQTWIELAVVTENGRYMFQTGMQMSDPKIKLRFPTQRAFFIHSPQPKNESILIRMLLKLLFDTPHTFGILFYSSKKRCCYDSCCQDLTLFKKPFRLCLKPWHSYFKLYLKILLLLLNFEI